MNILSIDRVLEFCIVYLLEHSNILSAARVVEFYISHLPGRASVGKVFLVHALNMLYIRACCHCSCWSVSQCRSFYCCLFPV